MTTLTISNCSDLSGLFLAESISSEAWSQSSGAPIAIRLRRMWYIRMNEPVPSRLTCVLWWMLHTYLLLSYGGNLLGTRVRQSLDSHHWVSQFYCDSSLHMTFPSGKGDGQQEEMPTVWVRSLDERIGMLTYVRYLVNPFSIPWYIFSFDTTVIRTYMWSLIPWLYKCTLE